MSRSRRKTKIFGNACSSHASEKEDKDTLHGLLRANKRCLLRKIENGELDFDEVVFDNEEEAFDVWGMMKDGKRYRDNVDEKDMRK